VKNAHLHHVGNAMRARSVLKIAHQQADHETAERRHNNDLPPWQFCHRGSQLPAQGAEAAGLHHGDELAKADTAIGGGNADQHRQQRESDLIVTQQAQNSFFNRMTQK